MKLVTFTTTSFPPRPGLLFNDKVIPLPFQDMLDVIQAGIEELKGFESQDTTSGSESRSLLLNEVRLQAPIKSPRTIRDFYAFEQHVKTSYASRGAQVPDQWYQMPVFYFSNPNAIFGPGDDIPYPPYSEALDYELEIACVIGKAGRDISQENALDYIFGLMIMNDWSARDEQRLEMKVGLGPAKGKDFATSLGPWILTLDELQERKTERPGVYDLEMVARVNGEEHSRGNLRDIYHTFTAMIARASAGAWLYPGDIIGSGTVGSGCLLELTEGRGPWLEPGDIVEFEVELLGVLRNTVKKSS